MKPALRRQLRALACTLALTGMCALARAQSASDSGSSPIDVTLQSARAAQRAHQWQAALKLYREVWAERKTYDVAANLAKVELQFDEYRSAVEHLTYALENMPGDVPESARATVQQLVEIASQQLGKVLLTVESGTKVQVDGVPREEWLSQSVLYLAPGPHAISVSRASFETATRAITIAKGETTALTIVLPLKIFDLSLPPVEPQSARVSAPEAKQPLALRERHAGMLLFGGGIALASAGLGAIFVRSASRADDAADHLEIIAPCAPNCDGPGYAHDARTEAKSGRTYAALSFSLAGVAALGTAAYFVWVPEEPARSRSLRPIVAGGLIALTGLSTGIVSMIQTKHDLDAANATRADFDSRGLRDHACAPGTNSLGQCADLFKSNRDHDQHRDLAVAGFALAGAAALGTVTYLAWPDSASSFPVNATLGTDGPNRMLVVFGNF